MSAKQEKRARAVARAASGISREAEAAELEFEQAVARRRYELALEPIGDRWERRRWNLALAALVLLTAALLFTVWAGLR